MSRPTRRRTGVDERAGETRRRPSARKVAIHAGVASALLLLAGGILYTAGALSYHRRRPDPFPAVFGFHEVFHACVCAAAACQYITITLLII